MRDLGYRVVMENQKKSVSSMFKYASKHQFAYAFILGEDELNKEVINIKNLKTHTQHTIAIKDVDVFMKEALQND